MGTVCKETYTKPLPAGAKTIVHQGQWLGKADVLPDYLGLELVKQEAK